jgi:hypothetical protein
MKILFVMDKREDAGSIQAIANYVRAGDQTGHTIALYGRPNPRFPTLRFAMDAGDFDHVVFVLESGLTWLSALRMPRLLADVPRERRAILDADGMYNPLISVDGYDRNHHNEQSRRQWLEHCALLSDRVFQPTITPCEPGVRPLPFYGFDSSALISPERAPAKSLDLLHLAHNWWRWREVSTRLLPALERIRSRLGAVCFMGSWWDAPPVVENHLSGAFRCDRHWFARLRIEIAPAVDYTRVISAMSTSRVNIMTQRPLFRRLQLLTSKYFEIFAADTVPLVMLDADHAEAVYGPAGRQLTLDNGIDEKLLDVLDRPRAYCDTVEAVRQHLAKEHSYSLRVQQLVEALRS